MLIQSRGSCIQMQLTPHEEGIQTIKVQDSKELKIEEKGKEYLFSLADLSVEKTDGLYKLEIPKNDVVIEGNGYFVSSPASFFQADIIDSVDLSTLDSLDNTNYILASTPVVKGEGGWLSSELVFDVKDLKIESGKLFFTLDSPELTNYGNEINMEYLEIEVGNKGLLSDSVKNEDKKGEEVKKGFFGKAKEKISSIFRGGLSSFIKFIDDKLLKYVVKKDNKKINNTNTPTSSARPSNPPTPIQIKTSVKILNGGAEEGEAGKLGDKLRSVGFTNITAENADNKDYQGARITYNLANRANAEKIITLLKNDYSNVSENAGATEEITIILGKK